MNEFTAGVPLQDVSYDPIYETGSLSLVIVIDQNRYLASHATWSENAHGASDQATIVVSLSTSPDFPSELFRGEILSAKETAMQGTGGAVSASNAKARLIAATSLGIDPNAPVYLELYAGFTQNPEVGSTNIDQLHRQFYGVVDTYSGSFDADTVTFTARSLAARLIDNKLTNISLNQTIEQFIRTQSAFYGLPDPVFNFPYGFVPATIQQVLAYDQIGGAGFSTAIHNMSPMDLIVRGSTVDDTETWVDVRTGAVHYESPLDVDKTRTQITMKYGRDWKTLSSTHSPHNSKRIQVDVHAYSPHTRISVTVRSEVDEDGTVTTGDPRVVTATSQALFGGDQTLSTSTNPATGSSSSTISSGTGGSFTARAKQGAGESAVQHYSLYVSGLSPEQARARANAYRRQISQHEYAIEGEFPMTQRLAQSLTITALLDIKGTPWNLVNDLYFPRVLDHTLSVEEGWHVKVNALNHRIANGGV